MKKFQLKYSAPKTKVNSAGKVEQQNQKKPQPQGRFCMAPRSRKIYQLGRIYPHVAYGLGYCRP